VAPGLLSLPGKVDLGRAGTMTAEEADADDLPDDPDVALIDAASVAGTLLVDAPRTGDRMRPLGMDGTRKLSDLLVDAKVPRRMRAAVPVVRDGDRVLWVAGVRLADEAKVGPGTRRAFRLTWHREE
jgi:tRNA(Ile)-lysidine synthetase-like protein